MNYLDTYFSRVNHLGTSTAERIRNGGIRSFEKWMAESPHTVKHLSVERGLYFSGIILTNKDKEYEKIMFLNVANDVPLQIGDIMNWTLDNGQIEKWILIQEEKKVNGTYQTFWIVRCNYLIKWINSQGHLQQSWSYFVSSLDSKIKGNFRTWHSLITPQPNKYAEILMPRYPIDRATNFIVEEESWQVIEYDHSSVPGVIYLSLTENKINLIYDDLENNIADTDKLAKYTISLPAEKEVFKVGDEIKPTYTLMKNGVPIFPEVELLPVQKEFVKFINGKLIAKKEGTTSIIVVAKNQPEIKQTIEIDISSTDKIFSAYIEGPDAIRLDRKATYILQGTQEIVDSIVFTIDNPSLASIINSSNNTCIIKANDKNELGQIVLSTTFQNITYSKIISIIPLW